MRAIVHIKRGAKDYSTYQGRLQYAVVSNDKGERECSATLEFILKEYWNKRETIINYKEALFEYIDFNKDMIKNVIQNE